MRKKMSDNKKRVDIGVTIDKELFSILEEYLIDNNISNRSKYIEKLIREDFERKGKNIEREF
jgi:metal-responsive CopG/Arc/MetJ family transcriptional regulator